MRDRDDFDFVTTNHEHRRQRNASLPCASIARVVGKASETFGALRRPEANRGQRAEFDACYTCPMGKSAESVTLDDDVQEELRKLAERSGRPVGVLANAALRDYVRYESQVGASIERGLSDLEAGRTRTTEDVLSFLQEQRLSRSRG